MVDEKVKKQLLETMLRIRRFEERTMDAFADGEIPGFVHLYIGEEAVAAGACATLNPDDYITSTHRGHGHCIAKGLEFKPMMAELYGKESGYCKGKGGSMHIADFDSGMLGANAIVGGNIPIAAGAALSSQVLQNGRVVLCFFGDGAVAEGSFHEGVNLAATWKLPVVFVVENNLFGELTPLEEQHNVADLSQTAGAYGIPGVGVDGMDVLAVHAATQEVVKRARDGAGPSLLECKTYRYRGHFEGDPEPYRTKEDVEDWKKRDPIERLKAQMLEQGQLDEAAFTALDTQIRAEVKQAVAFARNSHLPAVETAYTDVFSHEDVLS